MIKTTYSSPRSGNTSRYVARNAEGTCDADDLPADVKQAADELKNTWPNYVVWPKVAI
jgi:hypothetical protein